MNNQIKDISPLAKLTKLKDLYLQVNQINWQDEDWLKLQLPNCGI